MDGDLSKARIYNATQTLSFSHDKWMSFDSDRHPSLQKAAKSIVEWYNDRIPVGGALILAGTNGCGKTHLAKAIKDLYGLNVSYWNEGDFIKKVQSGYRGKGLTEDEFYVSIRRADLFIYDDLGAYETDNWKWIQGIYYNLFDGRLERKKATLVTTNLRAISIDENKNIVYDEGTLHTRLGAKAFDRLLGAVEFERFYVKLFDVPSYRMRNFGKEPAQQGRR